MKAALIFTGSGPILVLTTFQSLESPDFIQRLSARGILKFIAHEVPLELVQKRYGKCFSVIMSDLSQNDDLRVMDVNGHHVFKSFYFEELGPPIYPPPLQKPSEEVVIEEGIECECLWANIESMGIWLTHLYFPCWGPVWSLQFRQ